MQCVSNKHSEAINTQWKVGRLKNLGPKKKRGRKKRRSTKHVGGRRCRYRGGKKKKICDKQRHERGNIQEMNKMNRELKLSEREGDGDVWGSRTQSRKGGLHKQSFISSVGVLVMAARRRETQRERTDSDSFADNPMLINVSCCIINFIKYRLNK